MANLAQAALARLAGTSPPQIGRLEKGKRTLSPEWAEKIGRALKRTPAEISFGPEHGRAVPAETNTLSAFPLLAQSPVLRILAIAASMTGSEQRAEAWFKYQPLPGWSGKTAFDLVREDKQDKVLSYLEAVRSGVYS